MGQLFTSIDAVNQPVKYMSKRRRFFTKCPNVKSYFPIKSFNGSPTFLNSTSVKVVMKYSVQVPHEVQQGEPQSPSPV